MTITTRAARIALLTVALVASAAIATRHHTTAPSVVATSAASTVSTVRPSLDIQHHAPAPTPRAPFMPIESLGIMGLAAAKRGKATRRASGVKAAIPMYLDATAHLLREGQTVVIKGGVMVDDTDLTDEEIDELTARRAIRPATPDEIAADEQREAREAAAEREEALRRESEQLAARQSAERAAAEAEGKLSTTKARTELDERHAKESATLAARHAKAMDAGAES